MNISILTLNTGLLEIPLPILRFIPIVAKRHERFKDLVTLILRENTDLVILQEINGGFEGKLTEIIKNKYPFSATRPSGKILGNGLCTYSRFPIVSASFTPYLFASSFESIFVEKGVLKTVHATAAGNLTLLNTHLVATGFNQNPQFPNTEATRNEQVNELVQVAKNSEEPVIVGGDFNMGPEVSTKNYKSITESFNDVFTISKIPSVNNFTWDPKNPYVQRIFKNLSAQQVDGFYVPKNFVSRKMAEIETIVLNKIPVSDHYGVLLKVAINPIPNTPTSSKETPHNLT